MFNAIPTLRCMELLLSRCLQTPPNEESVRRKHSSWFPALFEVVVILQCPVERSARSRWPKFLAISLSRAVSIACSTIRLGMSPYDDSFSGLTQLSSYRTNAFSASCAPLSRCLSPQRSEGTLFRLFAHMSQSRKILLQCSSEHNSPPASTC